MEKALCLFLLLCTSVVTAANIDFGSGSSTVSTTGTGTMYPGTLDVPAEEMQALSSFFAATGGQSWTDKTGWAIAPAVEDWYGVTVTAGHVSGIDLRSNNLTGNGYNYLTPLIATLTSLQITDNPLYDYNMILPGLIAYYPTYDFGTTVCDNAEGTAARDGVYVNNPTLQGATFPVGGDVALFDGVNDYMTLYTADTIANWDWGKGYFGIWIKPTNTELRDASSEIYLMINNGYDSRLQIAQGPTAEATSQSYNTDWVNSVTNYIFYCETWDSTANELKVYKNGTLVAERTYTATVDPLNHVYSPFIFTGSPAAGSFPHSIFGAGSAITEEEVNHIYETVYPASKEIFACGDSKITDNDYWLGHFIGILDDNSAYVWREKPYRMGFSGEKIAYLHTQLDSLLPTASGNPMYVLVTIGTNDAGTTTESSFKADLEGCVLALHTKWPIAEIYFVQPYADGAHDGSYDAAYLSIKSWILTVVAEYAYTHAGPDENVWFKNGLATYSNDGIHPNTAGHIETANQWQTILGY